MATSLKASNQPAKRFGSSLLGIKLRSLWNAISRGSITTYIMVAVFVLLLALAEWYGTVRGVGFLCGYGRLIILETNAICSQIGLSVAQRVLETGLIVLSAGVTFSAITTAITTLYTSDDLNFLLAQPISAARVFTSKMLETYFNAAGIPTALIIPILVGIGTHFNAVWWYYPLALLAGFLVFALPVGVGSAIAVLLMRFAPVGRVREVATGLGVVLSASLVYLIRAARPEEFIKRISQSSEAVDDLIRQFAAPSSPLSPPAWAGYFIWGAMQGRFIWSIVSLLVLATVIIGIATWLATKAYQEGWVRGLESSRVKLDPTAYGPSWFERLLSPLGVAGQIIVKDVRLLLRDATQWSQLLTLVALAGVYLVSVSAFTLNGEMLQSSGIRAELFRNFLNLMQLAFQGFVLAGVGVRLAFPAVSLEGGGFWLLKTGPINGAGIVMAKFSGSLPLTLILAIILGFTSSNILALSPLITLLSVLVAASNATVLTALGVGIGAALPRFKSDNPAEVAVSAGGFLYMVSSLIYSAITVAITAQAAFAAGNDPKAFPGLSFLATTNGFLALAGLLLVTVLGTVVPLVIGSRRLEQHEDSVS
jgi:ABC-2 type transport system permease protein